MRSAAGALKHVGHTGNAVVSVAAALIALVAVFTLRPSQPWLAIVEVTVLASFVAGSAAVALVAVCQNRALR